MPILTNGMKRRERTGLAFESANLAMICLSVYRSARVEIAEDQPCESRHCE